MNLETQSKQNLVNLRGQLKRITFGNEDNGYVVAHIITLVETIIFL